MHIVPGKVTDCHCLMIQDSKMNELYKNDQLLSRFIGWARSKSEVLAQTGVYALGNLARSGVCVIWHSLFWDLICVYR